MTKFLFFLLFYFWCPKPTVINWSLGTFLKQKRNRKLDNFQNVTGRKWIFGQWKGELAWLDSIKTAVEFVHFLTTTNSFLVFYFTLKKLNAFDCDSNHVFKLKMLAGEFVLQTEISFFSSFGISFKDKLQKGIRRKIKSSQFMENWGFLSMKWSQ